jgi:hypothetical protein
MPERKPSSRKYLLALYFMVASEIRLRRKFGRVHHYKVTMYVKRVSHQQLRRKAETEEFGAVLPTSIKHTFLGCRLYLKYYGQMLVNQITSDATVKSLNFIFQ